MWWRVFVISAPQRRRPVNSWSSPSLAYLVSSRQTGDLASKASRGMASEEYHQGCVLCLLCTYTDKQTCTLAQSAVRPHVSCQETGSSEAECIQARLVLEGSSRHRFVRNFTFSGERLSKIEKPRGLMAGRNQARLGSHSPWLFCLWPVSGELL